MNEGFNVSVDASNFDNESEYSVTTNRYPYFINFLVVEMSID